MPVRQVTETQRLQDKSNVQGNVETSDNENAQYAESDEDVTYGLTPEELSVAFPETSESNHVEHPEIAVPLIDVDPGTEEVLEVDGHEETDDVNNQVTDDAVVGVPETGAYENETNAENNEAEEEYTPQRPVRNRRPPNMLHYDLMGHPTEFPPYVSSVQMTNQTFPPQEAFWPLTPVNPPIPVFSPNPFPFYPFPFPPPIPPAVYGYRYY